MLAPNDQESLKKKKNSVGMEGNKGVGWELGVYISYRIKEFSLRLCLLSISEAIPIKIK